MKKFLQSLYFWLIKMPVMLVVLLVQNTWQLFLIGIIFIIILILCAFLNSVILLFSFLTISTFFPVFFSIRNIKNCLHTLKKGLKADGILTAYRSGKEDFSKITFADKTGKLHSKKFRLFYISKPDYNKKFTVIYSPESPENFYISVKSLTGCIINLIFSLIIFTLISILLARAIIYKI